MTWHLPRVWTCLAAGWCCALGAGCASFQLPRIDPSGERIFLAPGTAPGAAAAVPATVPAVVGGPLAGPVLVLQPGQVTAPAGSEVILLAGVLGGGGNCLTGERVEWTIEPGGVGQFVEVGKRGWLDCVNHLRGLPKKVDATHAVNNTVWQSQRLDRGTATPLDDVTVASGQAWISVTSPVEGTTFVTAYAPGVNGWDRRKQTARIQWIDAQIVYPPPSTGAAGSRHPLVTLVRRQSDGSSVSGWRVRYEVTSGPEAGFAPDGAAAIEVLTGPDGQAAATLVQRQVQPGSNVVSIQVVRPAGAGGDETVMGTGTTTRVWTAAALSVRTTGPLQAAAGATVTYRIDVTNPGATAVNEVVLADQAPAGAEYLNSNPAAQTGAGVREWRLGTIGPGQTQVVEANYRLTAAGPLTYCASATGSGGLAGRGCTTTTVAAAPSEPPPGGEPAPPAEAPLAIEVQGPATAAVGDEVRTVYRIVNRSDQAVTGLVLKDRFDAGLSHATLASPIETDLPDLGPGASRRVSVTLRAASPGRHCQDVEVTAAGGVRVTARHCVTVAGEGPAPPAGEDTPPGRPALTVKKTGPARRNVGEIAEFVIVVSNTGSEPLRNILVSDSYDLPILVVRAATEGYRITASSELQWTIDALAPGKSIERQVNCECRQQVSRACNRVVVTADPNLRAASEACLEIGAAGSTAAPAAAAPAAGGNLSVSIVDQKDPIRAGDQTIYMVTVANGQADADQQVVVEVSVAEGGTISSVTGPTRATSGERTARFAPLAEMRAGESVSYEVRVRGDQEGTLKLSAAVTSRRNTQPVTGEASTEVLPK